MPQWDCVDIFSSTARYSKVFSKVSYFVLLLITVVIGALTVTSLNEPDVISPELLKHAVVILSLSASLVASFVTYFNPATQWQQLRGAALTLESEIWKFRTRTGDYSMGQGYSSGTSARAGEEHLRETCYIVNQHVLKSASVLETAFFSKFKVRQSNHSSFKDFRHGQHDDCSVGGTYLQSNSLDGPADDHHCPLTPENYLEQRVVPQLRFYQHRLPRYYRFRTLCEFLLISGALSGTVLAVVDLTAWAAIVTACTGAITAWLEFRDVAKKLSRYSEAVNQIATVVRWWESLTDVDRANLSCIDKLVATCEGLFQSERQVTSRH